MWKQADHLLPSLNNFNGIFESRRVSLLLPSAGILILKSLQGSTTGGNRILSSAQPPKTLCFLLYFKYSALCFPTHSQKQTFCAAGQLCDGYGYPIGPGKWPFVSLTCHSLIDLNWAVLFCIAEVFHPWYRRPCWELKLIHDVFLGERVDVPMECLRPVLPHKQGTDSCCRHEWFHTMSL